MPHEYRLRFGIPAQEHQPSSIRAVDDIAAIKIALSLKLRETFEVWSGDRFVKLIKRGKNRA